MEQLSPTIADVAHRRCAALTRAGKPCGAFALVDDIFCWRHSPNVSDVERYEASAKGGQGRSTIQRAIKAGDNLPDELRPIADNLTSAARKLHSGDISASAATALAAICGQWIKLHEIALESRLDELEAQIDGDTPRLRLVTGGE